MGQYAKNQSNTDIFRIGSIPVSPITTRSESARHIDNCKEKSREILDWLINKGIITWCFSYWPSYRSSVCCIGVRLRLRPIQQASDLWLGQYEKHHVIILYYRSVWRQVHYDGTDENKNKSVVKVFTHSITSITAHAIGLVAILAIMSVSTFKTAVILYLWYTES